jgi:hypothetical protein
MSRIVTRPAVLAKIVDELRRHRVGYLVVGGFAAAGPFATAYLFPEASLGVSVFGGVLFGSYAGLCAVPEKFLDG